MYEISPIVALVTVTSPAPTFTLSDAERITALEQEIYTLQSSKQVFDGVEIMTKQRRAVIPPPTVSMSQDKEKTTDKTTPDQPAASSSTTQPSTSASTAQTDQEPPIHTFASAPETSYRPPHECNFGAPPGKPNKDPAYHSVAPIQDPKIVNDVINRVMDTPSVMLSPRQIYAISPKVRNSTRDSLTPRCIMTDSKTVSTKVVIEEVLRGRSFVGSMQLLNDGIVIPDAYETYLKTLRPGEEPRMKKKWTASSTPVHKSSPCLRKFVLQP